MLDSDTEVGRVLAEPAWGAPSNLSRMPCVGSAGGGSKPPYRFRGPSPRGHLHVLVSP